ncbi:MAG: hypothetical protein HUJ31_16650 [Pseudomonadales bacterium]|nr:hypothetical protein [Pseudomonadales bacterium]
MDTRIRTRARKERAARPEDNPIFRKLPSQYYGYALQWCNYGRWTVEEASNLLAGCVPHRPMLLRGEEHAQLDQEVLDIENRIRGALGKELTVAESKTYFDKTWIGRSELLYWAKKNISDFPADLARAQKELERQYEETGYTTPCIEAIKWVVDNYWSVADLREPPTPGEIIHALLQQFPELTGAECEMIERVTRHPLAQTSAAD